MIERIIGQTVRVLNSKAKMQQISADGGAVLLDEDILYQNPYLSTAGHSHRLRSLDPTAQSQATSQSSLRSNKSQFLRLLLLEISR